MADLARPSEPVRGELPSSGGLQSVAICVAVIAALYFGRDIFVPLALAILLSFMLAPIIARLRRLRVPRTMAVVGVVVLAFLVILGFGVVVTGQISQLGSNLPQYQYNIQEKIRTLRANAAGGGAIEHASEMLEKLSREIDGTDGPAAAPATRPAGTDERPRPIPVEIRQPDPAPLQLLQSVVGPLISPLATTGVVIVFVIFMLLQREDMRDRFIRLAGTNDLHRTTQALSDAGKRVAKYLLMQLIVNITYGIPVGIGLWLIGVPNPLLWGMLATVLRFVPYVGPFVAAMFPLALAIAVDPGWSMLVWTGALFLALELISNNVIEPWLYGSSTGLSPVAIIVAAIFWTWLWGPVGLLLSTPLTVCLVVLGEHVPQFGFLHVLLGSEPVLTPQEQLYQRLLAGDPDEATERAEEFLVEHKLVAFYDEVAIPALKLVEQDRARGVLDDARRTQIVAGALTLIDNLADHEDIEDAPAEEATDADEAALAAAPEVAEPLVWRLHDSWDDRPVVCAGGRGHLDDTASAMLSQLLERSGVGTRTTSYEAMAASGHPGLDLANARLICLSFMNTESLAQARYLVRRLRRRTSLPILVGFWSMPAEEADRRDLVKTTHADYSATSLAAALDQVRQLAGSLVPAPLPADVEAAATAGTAVGPLEAATLARLAPAVS